MRGYLLTSDFKALERKVKRKGAKLLCCSTDEWTSKHYVLCQSKWESRVGRPPPQPQVLEPWVQEERVLLLFSWHGESRRSGSLQGVHRTWQSRDFIVPVSHKSWCRALPILCCTWGSPGDLSIHCPECPSSWEPQLISCHSWVKTQSHPDIGFVNGVGSKEQLATSAEGGISEECQRKIYIRLSWEKGRHAAFDKTDNFSSH